MPTLHQQTSGQILQGMTFGHDANVKVTDAQECVTPHSAICMSIA